MSAVKRLKDKEPRHVRFYHWFMDTEAWRDLDTVARCAYQELAKRYAGPGTNNGMIPCSLMELAEGLHVSKQTAMRALDKLEDHGFIITTKLGSFNTKARHSTEFRLTEFKDDVTGDPATKEFTRWRKSEHGSTTKPHRVSTWNRTGFDMEQVPISNRPYGSTRKPEEQSDGSTTKPPLVYQGAAPASARSALPSASSNDPSVEQAAQRAVKGRRSKPPVQPQLSEIVDAPPSRSCARQDDPNRSTDIDELINAPPDNDQDDLASKTWRSLSGALPSMLRGI